MNIASTARFMAVVSHCTSSLHGGSPQSNHASIQDEIELRLGCLNELRCCILTAIQDSDALCSEASTKLGGPGLFAFVVADEVSPVALTIHLGDLEVDEVDTFLVVPRRSFESVDDAEQLVPVGRLIHHKIFGKNLGIGVPQVLVALCKLLEGSLAEVCQGDLLDGLHTLPFQKPNST